MLSHEVYQMAMNFDEFKQLESSARVSEIVLLQFLNLIARFQHKYMIYVNNRYYIKDDVIASI